VKPWFLHKNLKKSSEIVFFSEISCKNLDTIWDKTRQVSSQTDLYSSKKKIKQFHTQTNLSFSSAVMNKKFIANLVG